jgi:ABC-2 type transport system permease protein
MTGRARYFRLLFALARYSLAREMAFRGNFLARVSVEVLWLALLLVFYRTVFARTRVVADWSEDQYLFFVGCYFALAGLVEAFFLENCNSFADLVRSGDLDFFLLQPIDEQFLITCRGIDWAAVSNLVMGPGIMVFALIKMGWVFDAGRVLVFGVMSVCGVAITYSLLLFLTATSVYFVRNQSLYELWWLFTSLMRYPREIFRGPWGSPIGLVFTFLIPILLVVQIPASAMARVIDPLNPGLIGFTAVMTVVLLWSSRKFFRQALRKYRSASS